MSGHNEIHLIVDWLLLCYETSKLRKEHEVRTAQTCPKCGKGMVNLGFTGTRPDYKVYVLHVCDDCKVAVSKLEDDPTIGCFSGRNLKEYEFL